MMAGVLVDCLFTVGLLAVDRKPKSLEITKGRDMQIPTEIGVADTKNLDAEVSSAEHPFTDADNEEAGSVEVGDEDGSERGNGNSEETTDTFQQSTSRGTIRLRGPDTVVISRGSGHESDTFVRTSEIQSYKGVHFFNSNSRKSANNAGKQKRQRGSVHRYISKHSDEGNAMESATTTGVGTDLHVIYRFSPDRTISAQCANFRTACFSSICVAIVGAALEKYRQVDEPVSQQEKMSRAQSRAVLHAASLMDHASQAANLLSLEKLQNHSGSNELPPCLEATRSNKLFCTSVESKDQLESHTIS